MKKLVSFLMTVAILVGTLHFGTADVKAVASKLNQDTMATVVLELKNKLDIGDEYTNFNYYFYDYGSGETWDFDWGTDDYSKQISAECDSDAHIKYMYAYSRNSEAIGIPESTREELLPKVLKLIEQVGGKEISEHISLDSSSTNLYSGLYSYNFKRVENGIDMPDNYLNVSVYYSNCQLRDYSINWDYNIDIPSAKKTITKQEASKKIGEKIKMNLFYGIGTDKDGNKKAYLYYEPDSTYIAVDALSSEIYTQKNYWRADEPAAGETAAMEDNAASAKSASLSEAELEKINDIDGIITADEAIAIVKNNKDLYISEKITTSNAYLQAYNGGYIWRVNMNDATPIDWSKDNDYYRDSVSARVDAKTGELKYFSASLKSYYDFNEEEAEKVKAKYTENECQKIFEEFASKVNGERFENTEFESCGKTHPIAYDTKTDSYIYGGHTFNYVRVNEGVRLRNNYISGGVDAVSGKISSYSFYWDDEIKLPSTKGVISAKEAFDAYLSYDGFDMIYEIASETKASSASLYGTERTNYVRLVYVTNINPDMVDAFTGRQIDYNGEEYSVKAKNLDYSDIEGTKYERSIKLLADMGIGFESEEFKPDEVITRDEFQQLADKCYRFNYNTRKISGSNKLTRRYAAYAAIGYLGLSDIADMKIFKTGYSDEEKITDRFIGSVALAKGYGIMGAASGKKFKPTAYVTRGEAADILLKTIGLIK